MTLLEIVAFYIALNLLLATLLFARVSQFRFSKKINLGDGGDNQMTARIRAQGNFIENTPFALLGLIGLAMLKAHPIALHIFGILFFIGRIIHAIGMANIFNQGRLIGSILTLSSFIGQALYIFVLIFTGSGT